MRNSLDDLLSLFFPVTCASCNNNLIRQETHVCTYCRFNLPKTNFHLLEENPVAKMFWGKVKIENSGSLYYFTKGGKVQRLIHQLKYKGNKEVGITLGKIYAADLKQSEKIKDVELIIPVPLHKTKLRKRGYNQSEYFGKGLSEGLEIPLDTDSLLRVQSSDTQTRKSRFKRWQNVESIFKTTNESVLQNKKILLVDDVVTTGSTLEACAASLLKIPGVEVSVATIAYAL